MSSGSSNPSDSPQSMARTAGWMSMVSIIRTRRKVYAPAAVTLLSVSVPSRAGSMGGRLAMTEHYWNFGSDYSSACGQLVAEGTEATKLSLEGKGVTLRIEDVTCRDCRVAYMREHGVLSVLQYLEETGQLQADGHVVWEAKE